MPNRIEHDSLGPVSISHDALYGPQTQRAINNFPISGSPMPAAFIRTLILIKQTAASVNGKLGLIPLNIADAIELACDNLLDDGQMMRHFPVDVFQTGSGTSSNMNANEVIARLAENKSGLVISPNDHVNYGQSSNDVIPTAIHVSGSIEIHNQLLPALRVLFKCIQDKKVEVHPYIKTGRTHLMDAMPVRMSQVLQGWEQQIQDNIKRIEQSLDDLSVLAIGGTAVGTGINTHPDFSHNMCQELAKKTGITFKSSKGFFVLISTQDSVVSASGALKTLAVSIMKIANDLRWMNSGPLAGLSEIELQPLQPGSSIMPGKVNPVIPEAAAMVAAKVIGQDTSITIAGQSGNFELNVMLPLIAHDFLSSIKILSQVMPLIGKNAIASFKVNTAKMKESLDKNPILVTALNARIGYVQAAKIAKRAYQEGRPIIDVAEEETDLSRETLIELLNPEQLTEGGIK